MVDLLHVLWDDGPDLDPCASTDAPEHELIGRARNLFGGPTDDGLAARWTGRVFVNPPFDALAEWLAKADQEHLSHNAEIVFLLPARTDTSYWHELVSKAAAVCFWRGRMKFQGAASTAPFPTALAYWGARPWEFHKTFAPRGMVVTP